MFASFNYDYFDDYDYDDDDYYQHPAFWEHLFTHRVFINMEANGLQSACLSDNVIFNRNGRGLQTTKIILWIYKCWQ